MKQFFTTNNIIIIIFAMLGLICLGIALKVYFFVYIGLISFAIAFAWLGVCLISKYNKEKARLNFAKQETIERLNERYDMQYVNMVFDPSSMESDFKKRYLKFKLFGILCIIITLLFVYLFIISL